MPRRPPLHLLDQSGASDGDTMVWSDSLNMWIPVASAGGSASSTSFTPTGGISATNVQAALAELDTEKAALASPALLIPPLKSGIYYSNPFASGSSTTTITSGALELHPFPIPFACTLDRIGAECTVSNASGRLRLGVYASDANGNPSTLVFDAGQVTSVAGGSREITISQAMTPGQYWLACLGDVVGGTWRTWGATPVAAVLGYSSVVSGSAYTRLGATGVTTGALPGTAPSTPPIASATGGYRIFARAA